VITSALLFVLASCDIGPEFGVISVRVGDRDVFFIREVRGNNYDSLVISSSSDPCQNLSSPNNYVFEELGPIHPYYRIEGEVLHLYDTSGAVPPRNAFPVRVVQHAVSPLEYADIAAAPQKIHVRRIDVPLNIHRNC